MPGIFLNEAVKEKVLFKFKKIKSVDEFAALLYYIELQNLNQKEKFKPLNSKHLYHLSKSRNNRYKTFEISKKMGEKEKLNLRIILSKEFRV